MTAWIVSLEELEDADDGTVILDVMEDVAQKHDGKWRNFETAPMTAAEMVDYLPARVLAP